MKICFDIEKAIVVKGQGTDKVILKTTHPGSVAMCPKEPLYLAFDATYDTGEAYCKDIFKLDPEVVSRVSR
jgi:hypothetical protein